MVLPQAIQPCWFPNYSCCWCFVRAGWSAVLSVPCVSAVPCPLPPGNPVSRPGQKQVWWRRRRSCFLTPWPGPQHRPRSSPGFPSKAGHPAEAPHTLLSEPCCARWGAGDPAEAVAVCHSCCPCLVPRPIVPLPSHPLTLLSLVNASLGAALQSTLAAGTTGVLWNLGEHGIWVATGPGVLWDLGDMGCGVP